MSCMFSSSEDFADFIARYDTTPDTFRQMAGTDCIDFINDQFAVIFGITKHAAIAQDDSVLDGLLVTKLYTAAKLTELILGDRGHNGQSKLRIFIQSVDIIILEEYSDTGVEQIAGKLDGVQGVTGKT